MNEKNLITLCFLALALAFSLGAAAFDLKTRKIPNKYNLTFFIIALTTKIFLLSTSSKYLLNGMIGALIGFAIFLPFFILRLAGGGDIKLLAALGMVLGWQHFLWVFVLTSVIDGAILIPARWLYRIYVFLSMPLPLSEKISNLKEQVESLKRSHKNPYALPVALGCLTYILIYLLSGDFFKTALGKEFDIHGYY
ncbi:MAG: prepilin peptidase [Candidatus Caenarcaniphilales bacterium]|nr:prepilin peptidase [Candidatus Caenarcaniphilales bacterium]